MIRRRSMRSGGGLLCIVLGLSSVVACGPGDDPNASVHAQVPPVEAPPPSPGPSAPTVRAGLPSPACRTGTSIDAGVHTRRWVEVDRQVIVHLPEPQVAVTGPPPVVFSLHGSAASAASHDAFLPFSTPAVERGYVVLIPEGMPPSDEVPLQVWELFPGIYPDDPGYLASLVDWIGSATCVDLDRVYAAGFSNGSTMTNVLACHAGGRFRAVGAVAAHRFPLVCPSGPVSVLGIHGTADSIVPYLGGPLLRRPDIWMPPVEETFDAWAEVGGCDADPRSSSVSGVVVRRDWDGCAPGIDVVLYSLIGGGHAWPRADDPLAPAAIDATTLILDFFDAN